MYKEVIIVISIVILVFIGDFITQNYTKKTIDSLTNDLENFKSLLMNSSKDVLNDEANKIDKKIEKIHSSMAYYMEHDEIEKVETSYKACKSLVFSENYDMAICELDKTIFILDHVKDRYAFNLENIF